jgi:dTDP-4-amino-4,6-dideoxygalactose transaminase
MPFATTAHHPDGELVRAITDACAEWLDAGEGFGMTSSITGDGAVRLVESLFSELHEYRPALLTPCATYAMRSALVAAGVRAGDSVVIPRYDWPSTLAALKSIGAAPVFIDPDESTLTVDPGALENTDMRKVKAAVVCHIHGTVADVPAIRKLVRDVPIIEDCAQALGSTLDDRAAGTLGDLAVFSFGPGKSIYAGEGGMAVARDWDLYEKLLRETAHPVRQSIGGAGDSIRIDNFSVRPHPAAAIMLFSALKAFDPEAMRDKSKALASELSANKNLRLVGTDDRRQNATGKIPVLSDGPDERIEEQYDFVPGRAFDLKRGERANLPLYIAG